MHVRIDGVNVDELMKRVQAEIRSRADDLDIPTGSRSGLLRETATGSADNYGWGRVHEALITAQRLSQVGLEVPHLHRFRGLIRKLAVFVVKQFLRVAQIITRDQRAFNSLIIGAFRSMEEAQKGDMSRLIEEIRSLGGRVANAEELIASHASAPTQLSQQGIRVTTTEELLKTHSAMISLISQQLRFLSTKMAENANALQVIQAETATSLRSPNCSVDSTPQAMSTFEGENGNIKHEDSLYDDLFMEIEDNFRNPRSMIKEQQKIYLPLIIKASAGTQERMVLDLGCGRGEWLELLKEEGCAARGLDKNSSMVRFCESLELDVIHGDIFRYLRTVPEETVGAVTGFHILEHLSIEKIIELFDHAFRILRKGGIVVVETPNPENILVGSCSFHLDPTHRTPLPQALLKVLAESRGLSMVETLPLNPCPEGYAVSGFDSIERFNKYFYGPRDYALIGWKA